MFANSNVKTVLLVGLGNPGYSNTRHNLGADFLLSYFKDKNKSFIKPNLFTVSTDRQIFIVYICPSVMNLSGPPIKTVYDQFKCDALVVFVDDMETEIGKFRLSFGVGSNGHNGLKSVVKAFNGKKIYRFRLGIGRPANGDVSTFVLEKFPKGEMALLENMFKELNESWILLLRKKFGII